MDSSADEAVDAYVDALVAVAPVLTDEQRHTIAASLGGVR